MEYKAKINHAKKRKVREHRVEVRLSDDELAQLKNANAPSIAKLLRESALRVVNKQETQVPQFTKLDRDFLLELSRIGNNINQIAHAVNRDLAADRPLDAARLLHLLAGIDQVVRELRNDC
ncbi:MULTISPECIES: MobC family plasmid mobilization relaxosome protein [Acinetobacter]|uniref:MobC family plasmid mobilization relaxosome protein n=1 Tax=Acinetobacter TaxID=469 RepID=UPI001F06DB25|nr:MULTISPECIES: MobC family plasmid mobilization relaxosome protein [Acinetobacter]MCH2017333.1 MobC family plasmid mobilization relaxosome protein [Acinetobacter ursingii]MDH1007077.1 MobC family plasmid mobilization relaxosome protein [Acinetobacter junii]